MNKITGAWASTPGAPVLIDAPPDTLALLQGFWTGYDPYESIELENKTGIITIYNAKAGSITQKGNASIKNGHLVIGNHSFKIDQLPVHDTFGLNIILDKHKLHGPYIPMFPRALVSGANVNLVWSQPSYTDSIHIQYRVINTNEWTTLRITKLMHTLQGLEPNTAYEWRLRSVVRKQYSNFSSIHTFTTR